MLFENRADAGRRLAARLQSLRGGDVLVLALPRGGVPVAAPVADKLLAELDVLLVRKLGIPGHEELAMGAIALGGVRVLNEEVITALGISQQTLEEVTEAEAQKIQRRAASYRGSSEPPRVRGRTVVVVDDGLATGATARAALQAIRQMEPRDLILAVPVAPASTIAALQPYADRIECLATPEPFHAVGLWYRDFGQTSDEEVRRLLSRVNGGEMPAATLG